MIRPILGTERVPQLLQQGLAMGKTELRKVACLRRDERVFSGKLDRFSDIVLIPRADVSTDELNQCLKMHVRDMLKHGRRYGSWQLMQP